MKRFPLTLSDLSKPGGAGSPSTSAASRVSVAVKSAINGTPRSSAGISSKSGVSGVSSMSGIPVRKPNTPARVLPVTQLSLTSDRVRERMVERVALSGVSHPQVLQALRDVPRHLFVDAALAPQAYEEAALPIGHRQTISKPAVVARMIEIAMNGRARLPRVLEVGTGCGYQAAVLSRLADEVFSIERIRPLHERAKLNLRPLRAPNIRLHYGDGRIGLPACAPFDAIVIAAAGLDVPVALAEQLTVGGRLIAPVGGDSQVLTLVERLTVNQWRETVLDRVFFVPLKSGVI